MIVGALVLTTALWAGPSHSPQGQNWVLILEKPLIFGGLTLVLFGIIQRLRVDHVLSKRLQILPGLRKA